MCPVVLLVSIPTTDVGRLPLVLLPVALPKSLIGGMHGCSSLIGGSPGRTRRKWRPVYVGLINSSVRGSFWLIEKIAVLNVLQRAA
jgi:hypothetical protein